jgi:hypothetical protein
MGNNAESRLQPFANELVESLLVRWGFADPWLRIPAPETRSLQPGHVEPYSRKFAAQGVRGLLLLLNEILDGLPKSLERLSRPDQCPLNRAIRLRPADEKSRRTPHSRAYPVLVVLLHPACVLDVLQAVIRR